MLHTSTLSDNPVLDSGNPVLPKNVIQPGKFIRKVTPPHDNNNINKTAAEAKGLCSSPGYYIYGQIITRKVQ